LGEFSYMSGMSISEVLKRREEIAKRFSSEYGVVLVLKGSETLVASKGKVYKNSTGNSGLSKAGTGDVLTGIIAGIISQQKLTVFDSCRLAVYLHGLTGDILAEEKSSLCIMATELIEYLPRAITRLM